MILEGASLPFLSSMSPDAEVYGIRGGVRCGVKKAVLEEWLRTKNLQAFDDWNKRNIPIFRRGQIALAHFPLSKRGVWQRHFEQLVLYWPRIWRAQRISRIRKIEPYFFDKIIHAP